MKEGEEEASFLFTESQITLKSLYSPSFGKIFSSKTKELEGLFWKKGEIVKNWKERIFIVDGDSRAVFYFKDKKPESVAVGYISLYDVKISLDVPGAPRVRGAKSFLSVGAPFRRTYELGFADDNARDQFKKAILRVRSKGRSVDGEEMLEWWRTNISREEFSCSWGQFSHALSTSFLVNLEKSTEAALRYVLWALNRTDQEEQNVLDCVSLSSLLEFSYLFGGLAEGLDKLDGVLLTLCLCTAQYAEKILTDAPQGTFCLYVVSRPTAESLAVFGVAFVNVKNRVFHKKLFRDPVCKKFFVDSKDPCFDRMDYLIVNTIGLGSIFARQTRAKFDEINRIEGIIFESKKAFDVQRTRDEKTAQVRKLEKKIIVT